MKIFKKALVFLLVFALTALCGCKDENKDNSSDDQNQNVTEEITLSAENVASGYYLKFNCTKEPFDNVNVRRAFAFALQNSLLAEHFEEYLPLDGFVPPNVPYGLDRTKTFREMTDTFFMQSTDFAKILFNKAGYTDYNNFPRDFLIISEGNTDFALDVLTQIMNNLSIIGNLNVLDTKEEFDALYDAGEYDLAIIKADCAEDMLKFFGEFDSNEWQNEKYQRVLQELSETSDSEIYDKMFLFEMAEGILFDEMPVVPLIYTEK